MTKDCGYPKMKERSVDCVSICTHSLVYDSVETFTLRESSGAIGQRNDSKYELSSFQVRLFIDLNAPGTLDARPRVVSLRGSVFAAECGVSVSSTVVVVWRSEALASCDLHNCTMHLSSRPIQAV